MIKTDYSKVSDLFLAYPKGFDEEYNALTNFYQELISIIPEDVHQYIIINNKEAEVELRELFPMKRITPVLIEGFNEIWLRDIMGFNVGDKIIKPKYKPTYYKDVYNENFLDDINSQVREIINKTIKKKIIDIPLIWDGGNLVTNGKVGLITDKILRDNPKKSATQIKSIIEEYLGIRPIIIPTSENDKLGHSDGYLAFLNEEEICLSCYPNKKFLEKDIEYIEKLHNVLLKEKLKVIRIYDRPVDERTRKGNDYLYSARGNYSNFLLLNSYIILPAFTLPIPKETSYYNTTNNTILDKHGYTIQIDCTSLGKLGGVLHCVSFTY